MRLHDAVSDGDLAKAAIPVAVANPRQVRDFAKATGRLAKTDALDALAPPIIIGGQQARTAPGAAAICRGGLRSRDGVEMTQ
ncbi:MAG: hypothetical protein HY698_05215 [Deltaproteobacteria bacterium]|nr:hypothetical protein [Deltaproteobacteria bacterium]